MLMLCPYLCPATRCPEPGSANVRSLKTSARLSDPDTSGYITGKKTGNDHGKGGAQMTTLPIRFLRLVVFVEGSSVNSYQNSTGRPTRFVSGRRQLCIAAQRGSASKTSQRKCRQPRSNEKQTRVKYRHRYPGGMLATS